MITWNNKKNGAARALQVEVGRVFAHMFRLMSLLSDIQWCTAGCYCCSCCRPTIRNRLWAKELFELGSDTEASGDESSEQSEQQEVGGSILEEGGGGGEKQTR